jgi:hypothetical protein
MDSVIVAVYGDSRINESTGLAILVLVFNTFLAPFSPALFFHASQPADQPPKGVLAAEQAEETKQVSVTGP